VVVGVVGVVVPDGVVGATGTAAAGTPVPYTNASITSVA
jgi:hypothetical protein